jgi:hypothetical protein
MRANKTAFKTVRKIALAMPDVEESTTYGSPCVKVRGKLFACIAVHRSAEPNTLVVRVESENRQAMIEDAPDVYYLTDHYVNYPFVLVRLNRIQPAALEELLRTAWRLASAKTTSRNRTARAARKRM